MKVILHLATLFALWPLHRFVFNKVWFLSTHSSSPSAPVRYNTHTRVHGRDTLRAFAGCGQAAPTLAYITQRRLDETPFELPPLF
jgi:hypothetical protein